MQDYFLTVISIAIVCFICLGCVELRKIKKKNQNAKTNKQESANGED